MVGYVDPAPEWRGTSVQVCGLWPFGAGAGTPMVGVPLGRDLDSGATVCCDPVSWFTRTGLLANPSMFVLGRPASASRRSYDAWHLACPATASTR